MQAVSNPAALELSSAVIKTVTPTDFVNETLDRTGELQQLKDYIIRQLQKTAEVMLITAIKNNVTPEVIEAMRKNTVITETRLAELKQQAQTT